jgi:hypothetical protein
VYAKAPFGGPQQVLEYLGRYTHKIAISNQRILAISEDGIVRFRYKDYGDDGKQKEMSLTATEFERRFIQHILPPRFTKIRTYGYLSNRGRHSRIKSITEKLTLPAHPDIVIVPIQILMLELYGLDVRECPVCHQKTLVLIKVVQPWKLADDG